MTSAVAPVLRAARALSVAFGFMTRLPMPAVKDFGPRDLERAATWFPFVGLALGAGVAAALAWAPGGPWVGAWLGLLVWVWVTGALHLDGLGDVADGFGAAHRVPERFYEVLKDPHMGVFGVVVVVMQLLAKLVLLMELSPGGWCWGLVLVPAWARWATMLCGRVVPRYDGSAAEPQTAPTSWWPIAAWAVLLGGLALWLAPVTLLALPLAGPVVVYWRLRLGWVSGDCFGASIEVVESVLLLALVVAADL